jgi:hypothetical protein
MAGRSPCFSSLRNERNISDKKFLYACSNKDGTGNIPGIFSNISFFVLIFERIDVRASTFR